ncbi:midasin [Trametes coccinea BRFM310]|uniref:Midasin n=1 Tax=Trametes coccinea (strain BRFM310) TaxID=1353009 RepID=A0A1Y2IPG6_TRAC3|nr:midasin [Trametes coccinea BRFM310]
MADHGESFMDTMHLNLKRQTQKLLDQLLPESTYYVALKNAGSQAALLETLSNLMLMPPLTITVAQLFRPLLVDLCARWLQRESDELVAFEALCLLLEIYPEVYSILSCLLRRNGLERGPLALWLSSQASPGMDSRPVHRTLLAYYRLLRANRTLPHALGWSLSPLSQLMQSPHSDNGCKLLAVRCYALQSGMLEGDRVTLEKEVVGDVEDVDCPVQYAINLDGTVREVDGWVLPVLEMERISRARDALLDDEGFYIYAESDSSEPIHPAELSPLVANIHGILMLRSSATTNVELPLIDTPTAIRALRQMALHLSSQLPILLTSAPSAGKSLLISHMAQLLYPGARNHIVSIHLADTSLDPRSLLGSYVSSPTRPGTFEWKEGVLVRAMRQGKWVVFEDIDRATMEVLGIIKPLVESLGADKWIGGRARLEIPSRGIVEAQDSFAVFATRSVQPSRRGAFPAPTFYGAHKFYEVILDSPSASDLRMIIDTKFPRLAGAPAQGLIKLWEGVRAPGTPASTRDVGLRELERLCTRVSVLLPLSHHSMDVDEESAQETDLAQLFPNPTVREDIFLEARDVFFGAGATTMTGRAHLAAVADIVARHLGISEERKEWILHNRTPEFDVEKDVNGRITAVRAGRTRLPARTSKMDIAPPATRPFAMHRPAVSLMARLATAISLAEPILLTGETGTGKTSVVTHLASLLRRPLISLNLSNQTESSDILGGFKPVDARIPGAELQQRFLDLFGGTFSRKKNAHFEESVRKAVQERKWKRAAGLWLEATKLAKNRIQAKQAEEDAKELEGGTPRKRRKVESAGLKVSMDAWDAFERDVQTFEVQHVQGKSKFAFAFVEGPLVKALRNGDWILLDELNLATPETLESISALLQGPTASITLTEQGSLEPIPRHPDFRLFACMNPATDVGKKDLPPNIRSRFTEIDVPPPDADKETLLTIVAQYIGACAVGDKGAIMDVAEFYSAVKRLAEERQIADGSNHRPHFSMRTLARALTFAADMAPTYSLRRALWEGCLMAFTMVLDGPSATAVTALAQKHILAGVRNPRSLLAKEPLPPSDPSAFVKFGPFYLERGPLPEDPAEDYIMTPSVETKLIDLARIISAKRFPVLIEGPTSSGKTSSIEYLAKRTGHRFVRINNHEHTDIQEYIGTYVSDPVTGKLVFKEGLLVRALRQGDWIVLDELNLAPTDVLEALNRLLDDNRELVIPETQEVVRPHPHFMLFATQNPPGLYAGRKVLSRAFRNRFLEVHFEDVPQAELETILCQRCRIAPSYGQRIVAVFRELQKRRQSSRVFESKQGFATLRDLFRWAGRDAISYEELAANGYMLLAERARRDDDKAVVKEVIESIMKVRIDESSLYDLKNPKFDPETFLGCPLPSSSQVVWTSAMQRLFVLTARALRFNEPVLLVGETGCGKTSVCQLYAEVLGRALRAVNCHQNTETADLIGGLRPIRNKAVAEAETIREAVALLSQYGVSHVAQDVPSLTTAIDGLLKAGSMAAVQEASLHDMRARLQRLSAMFEWRDGPLVEAMRNGDVFLLDEISLADDSVLERLNSVLESGRTIVLAERGGSDEEIPAIKASEDFKFVATMNPGGDYGKKELSPALRNRFTEIWVPPITDRRDLECIVETLWKHEVLRAYTKPLLDFVEWLCAAVGDRAFANLRDILAWVSFSNAAIVHNADTLLPNAVFHHAAEMTFLDGLGSMPQLSAYSKEALERLKSEALAKLHELVPLPSGSCDNQVLSYDPSGARFGVFSVPRGPLEPAAQNFSLEAPTTRDNVMRVVRACQLQKPIMLEGSPGVGKTSLVAALANMCGYHLCRINLSDQTDLVDLFGSDLPVEGGEPGQFAWKDAEFLRALQEGHWVLLDEMNLAPQSVLEGLNAVLDHRGTVYIPELGRSFVRHPSFRIFAAQNPLQQGGGRKGLPKSFLNRFTKVYVQEMSSADLLLICRNLFPQYPSHLLEKMISYMGVLNEETMVKRSFAREGAPWEFNLRDVIRWATLLCKTDPPTHPSIYLSSVILQRFRTPEDRNCALKLFTTTFGECEVDKPVPILTPTHLQIGHYRSNRSGRLSASRGGRILRASLPALESLGTCVSHGWLAIVNGPKNSGKTTLVRTLANLLGKTLHEVTINNATDATDILGSFEETDLGYRLSGIVGRLLVVIEDISCSSSGWQLPVVSDSIASLRLSSDNLSSSSFLATLGNLNQILEGLSDAPEPYRSRCATISRDVLELSKQGPKAGRLEWVDGPLVRALKEGHWLLLDGANLCSASVLDRLNSLCEMGGALTLNERGAVNGEVQILYPHPDFRLFMSADPQYGELSRAMRNRGIEIALPSEMDAEDFRRLLDHLRCPPRLAADPPDLRSHFTTFSLVRRGVAPYSAISPAAPSWPSDGLLAEDSANGHAAELGPPIATSFGAASSERAILYFIAANVVPDALKHLSRLIPYFDGPPSTYISALHAFLGVIACSDVYRNIVQMRKNYSHSSQIPCDVVLAQPLYVDAHDTAYATSHAPLDDTPSLSLRYLRLLTAVTSDFERVIKTGQDYSDTHAKRLDKSRPENRAVIDALKLVNTIREVASAFLNRPFSPIHHQDVDVLLKFAAYGRFLQSATPASGSFDFSLALAVVEWMEEALSVNQSTPDTLVEVARAVSHLREAVSLSTGTGLFDLWRNLWPEQPDPHSGDMLAKLENAARSVRNVAHGIKIRGQMLDLMSLWVVANVSPENHRHQIIKLSGEVAKRLAEVGDLHEVYNHNIDYVQMCTRLQALHGVSTDDPALGTIIQSLIDISCSDSEVPLHDLIAFKRIVWARDAGESVAPVFIQSVKDWLGQLWAATPTGELSGASALCHPIELSDTVIACDDTIRAFNELAQYDTALKRRLTMRSGVLITNASRWAMLLSLLTRTTLLVVSSITSSVVEHMNNIAGHPLDVALLITTLDDMQEPRIASSYHKHLRIPFQALRDADTAGAWELLGHGWIGLSRFLLELYIPNVPVDPAAIEKYSVQFWEEQRIIIEDELRLHHEHEHRRSGRDDNVVSRYLSKELSTASRRTVKDSKRVPNRFDTMKLHAYWAEVAQFLAHAASTANIDSIVTSLQAQEASGSMREQVFQESTAAFTQRLDSAYPDFADVSGLLQLALSQQRLGLRLIADAAASSELSDVEGRCAAAALVAFPTVLGSEILLAVSQPAEPSFSLILAKLAAVASDVSSGVDLDARLRQVEEIYEQSLGLWLIDKARAEEAEREAQSLYRHKMDSHAPATDAELEEQEFLALFPEYEDLLEANATPATQSRKKPSVLVDSADTRSLCLLHQRLFGKNLSPSSVPDADFWTLRKTLVRDILSSQASRLPETLDQLSRPYQISLLLGRLSMLHGSTSASLRPYNFYSDPNLPEIRKGLEVLRRMVDRLVALIKEWPDQMVLQHLKARCEAILNLDIFSPVAKILSAIEQLLLQMEDWEMYANRENTLKAYQHDLASLVVSWRRLELTSWQGLLRTQAQEFADGASEYWFRLYEATARGVVSAIQEEELGEEAAFAKYIDGLVPLLDTFISSTPLGQFAQRLDYLEAFENYCKYYSGTLTGTQSAAFHRAHRVLRFTRMYYAQFAPRIASSLASQQEVLEKEIRGFIKLASWKDINVHALKQSAQRTHRQLYKCVRKFKEILRQPVTPLLVPPAAGPEEATTPAIALPLHLTEGPPSLPAFSDNQPQPEHLLNLERTFKNFQSVVRGRIGSLVEALSPGAVEDISGEIITTLQRLASASVPNDVTGEQREKAQKAILVRKRKAWSDLLKELKRIGLAMNVKPEVLEQQSNPRWLREQPVVADMRAAIGPFEKSEVYLLRLSKLLPDLRSSLSNHNPDVGTRDLQRGTNLVESAFSLAVEARASFVDAVEQHSNLQELAKRLHTIAQHPRIVASGPEAQVRAVHIKEDLGRLVSALEETNTIWKQYLDELPEDTEALPSAMQELTSAIAVSNSLFNQVADVTAKVKLTPVPVLLEDEAALIEQALDHVRTVGQLLRGWTEGPNVVAIFARSVLEWLEKRDAFSNAQFEHIRSEVSTDNTAGLIDRLLLSAQGILAIPLPPAKSESDMDETPDRFVRDYNRSIMQITRALKQDEVSALLTSVVKDAVRTSPEELGTRLARILPFLDTYLELARVQLTNHCAWTKALFKLDYVICTVMRTIAQDGFCKPPDAGEAEAGEGAMEDAGGVGLGEGTGKENVSKEIEDESQVEGLQGEAEEDEDVERAEEGNALEMSEDFGGKMQDVEEEEGEGEEDEDEGSDEEEPEEQIGDLDAADPSAVDEKLWGDESGPEDTKQDQNQTAEDHSTKQQQQESETVAKEDEGRKESKEKQKEQSAEEGKEGEEGEEPVPEDAMQEEEAQEEEGEQDQQGGAPLDDFVPEANTLDLPEDLDFGKDDGKEPEMDEDIDMGEDEGGEDEAEGPEEERPGEGVDEGAEEDDAMDMEDNPQAVPEEAPQPENVSEDIVDGATAQPDLHAGIGQDSGEAGDQAMADAEQGQGAQGPSSAGKAGGPEEEAQEGEKSSEDAAQEQRPQEQSTDAAANATEAVDEGKDTSGSARSRQGAAPSQMKSQPLQNNPLRSIGDALREISQRFDEILEGEGPQERTEEMDTSGAPQLEYLRPEEDKGADEMQALGPAQQEDVAKLNELKFLDQEAPPVEDVQPMDEDPPELAPEPSHRPPTSTLHAEPAAQAIRDDVKSALTQTEVRSQQPGQAATGLPEPHPSDKLVPAEDAERDPQLEVELALRQWQAEGQPGAQAEDMWRKYESLTHDLSYALCEQLRLILEPTMATRLKGDYRTGKRLNMKKIIPYIASEFTKDKIWLRRTRPSTREYQVLIALDDSRSMAESHSVHLAFQTLALVAKALGRLEVGDVAIAKFGEAVDVLHGFDGGPFTDQAGTRVMSAFRFDQKATQVLSLVETSLKMLEEARERRAISSSSAADLWQLEIIISDGICQDHERLRTVLRRAEEQRVMVVFIVLDSLHSKSTGGAGANENSILSMNQVAYKMVDGRMDLQVERYLDTFPFEYYVVLRNVEALPDVLAGTLKQFFERVAEA